MIKASQLFKKATGLFGRIFDGFNQQGRMIAPERNVESITNIDHALRSFVEEVKNQENSKIIIFFKNELIARMLEDYPKGSPVSWKKYCEILKDAQASTRNKVYAKPTDLKAEISFRVVDYWVNRVLHIYENMDKETKKYLDEISTDHNPDFHHVFEFMNAKAYEKSMQSLKNYLEQRQPESF
jgi:hypothetical protein